MKVTSEIKKEMKRLRDEGKSYREIARTLNLAQSTVQYWLKPEFRKKHIEICKENMKNLTPEQKQRHSKRHTEYARERYRNDEEFRRRIIENTLRSWRKRKRGKVN